MINEIFTTISKASTCTNDGVDRLNYYITSLVVIILASFATMRTYVGDPMDCWSPTYFSGQWVHYTDTYCWVKNTYYLPFETTIEQGHEQELNLDYEIKYYQWVPIILAVQALLFFLPSLLWDVIINRSLELENIITASKERHIAINPQERDVTMNNLAEHFDRYLMNTRDYKLSYRHISLLSPSRYRRSGSTFGPMYLMLKTIYLVNASCQLFALDTFVGKDFHWYGVLVMRDILSGKDWTERSSIRFPTITLCDFTVRTLANLQKFTVQCVLSINLFNEKTFLFLWFWIFFITVVTSVNLIIWVYRISFKGSQADFIEKHLELMGVYMKHGQHKNNELMAKKTAKFIKYIKPDGVFILRFISANTSSLIVSELLLAIWKRFSMLDKPNASESLIQLETNLRNQSLNEGKSLLEQQNISGVIKDPTYNDSHTISVIDGPLPTNPPPPYNSRGKFDRKPRRSFNQNKKYHTGGKAKVGFIHYFKNAENNLSAISPKSGEFCLDSSDISAIEASKEDLSLSDSRESPIPIERLNEPDEKHTIEMKATEKQPKEKLGKRKDDYNDNNNDDLQKRLALTFCKDSYSNQTMPTGMTFNEKSTGSLPQDSSQANDSSLLPQTTYSNRSTVQPTAPVKLPPQANKGIANLSTVMLQGGRVMGRKMSTGTGTYARTTRDFKKGAAPVAARKDMAGRKTMGSSNLPSLTT